MRCVFFLILLFLSTSVINSQNGQQAINLKDITDRKFVPRQVPDIQSMPDGEHYTMLSKDKTKILKYAYKDGKEVGVVFDVKTVRETVLDAISGYVISPNGFRIIVWNNEEYIYRRSWKADFYDYDVRRNFLKPLSDTKGKAMIPTFSPDGRMCAYVKDNNIWLKKFDYDTESQVTRDGAIGKILNGITDWVYEEEFIITNLMSWSPDSKMLAFVKFDEAQVPSFDMQLFDGSLYPGFQSFKYPKAGEKNAVVGCYSYNVETKDIKKMNVPMESDDYIPLIRFTTSPEQLAVMTLNRAQNVFSMYYVNPKSAVSKLVLKEENKFYIDPDLLKFISFTPQHFVYLSEKSGFTHIYLYSLTGVLQKQLTSGNWDVTACYGIDPVSQTVYYQSAEESPLRRAVYKIDIKGNKTKLSLKTGTNNASFNDNFNYFINQFSNAVTPTVTTIQETAKGKELVLLEDNKALQDKLSNIKLATKEFFSFNLPQGMELNGWMVKPLNFSPGKKYPVVMYQYSGPGSQEVLDRFKIDWEYYLSAAGYIVVCVDGRGTGARGEEFRKCTYMNLGQLESDDQIAAADYLATLPYVDKNNMAIWGWSYGGYNTLMSMSKTDVFKAGVAVAPVTSWKYYNTVYTERFMRTPNENFTGYTNSSPISFVQNLQGKLLLIHGTSDDNVHYQNTLYYADALVEAGKQFDMQIYTGKNHSLLGSKTRYHLYTRMTEFLNSQLK